MDADQQMTDGQAFGHCLGSEGSPVQQRSTATVEPELGPHQRHQTSDQRMSLHRTLQPTVVVQGVTGSNPIITPLQILGL